MHENTDRDPIFDHLQTMWEESDPIPAQLVDRIIAALAVNDIDREFELMTLVNQSNELAGTRSATTTAMSIEFAYQDISVLVRVSEPIAQRTRRIDGWIAPQRSEFVRLTFSDGSVDSALVDGRFEFDDVPEGLVRLWFGGPEDSDVYLATPLFEV